MGVRIVEGTFAEYGACMQSMYEAHWREVAHNKDKVPLEVDYEKYRTLEKTGLLVAIIVFRDQEIIGYSAFFLSPHPHYKSLTVAYNDVIFLRKEDRQSGISDMLSDFSDAACKARGAGQIVYHFKPDHDHESFMTRHNCKLMEKTYGKLL